VLNIKSQSGLMYSIMLNYPEGYIELEDNYLIRLYIIKLITKKIKLIKELNVLIKSLLKFLSLVYNNL